MGLAEGVATDDQRRGLDIVHGHPAEGLADIGRRRERIRVALRPFGVDVDQAHVAGAQRVLQLRAVTVGTGVALLAAQPFVLGAPVHVLLGLPVVRPAEREARGGEAHLLQCPVTGEHQQIRPGQLLAVLLLDRPEQPARLVQADVVGPAVERGEALHALTAAAAAVGDPVRARGVPGHPDEERAVVAEVGGPPVLRVGHHGVDIGGERRDVQVLHGFAVIESGVRVDDLGILLQNLQIDRVGPPVTVASTLDRRLDDHRAFRLGGFGLCFTDRGTCLGHVVDPFRGCRTGFLLRADVRLKFLCGNAIGAQAPVDDLGLVDRETVVVCRGETGSLPHRALDVGDDAA